ncbi:MAG: CDP-alcohol phosphatidyltransferase family protein [Spirochaetota bacterium]
MPDKLSRSIIGTSAAFLFTQFAIFAAYALPFRFTKRYTLPFIAVAIAYHGLVLGLLFLFKGDFVKEPGNKALDRVNLANKITLFRLSTLPTALFILLASKDFPIRLPLVALVALVFATDFLDGYVSRKDKQATKLGKMMDSASDYALLFAISIVFYYFHIIPAWFLNLLVVRLAGQALMVLTVLVVKKQIAVRTSFMGKATVASTMILYVVELFRLFTGINPMFYRVMEYAVAIILAISILDKIILMAKDLRAEPAGTKGSGRISEIQQGAPHAD